ncbi:MAG TPA: HAMP domain-containing sensor histidine kinase [Bacteroidales bacterium]|nr:HAMP domain-containing sensor histidine kinase [Bacteroidales bacterium]
MMKLGTKLALYNFISKLFFVVIFMAILPFIVEKFNIIQTDRELVDKREQVIDLISEAGIEPFMVTEPEAFSSYNILKEEYITIRKDSIHRDWNYIEISKREIDDEIIEFRVLNYSFQVSNQNYVLEVGKSLPRMLYVQKNMREIIIVFMISVILLMLLSDLLFTDQIVKPLKHIIRKLRKTSTPALFDQTPVKTGTTDFLQLDMTIRDIMKKMDTMFLMEKEITVNISHELLTPVSVLRSRLENMLLLDKLDIETREKIEESLRTLYRLKTLVNSLLLISRIESQQYLKEDSFELKDLLDDILEELAPIAADKEISVEKDTVARHFLEKANKSLVFSMIYNVVNNAIQNTGQNGKITINSSINNGKYEFSITDTGCGMDSEQLRHIFSRFRKKSGNESERNGIGLIITKTIADFHNIKMSISSEPGVGTKISFAFPENS